MRVLTHLFALCFLLFTAAPAFSQSKKFTVSGYVSDAETGEKLIGARVFDPIRKVGALTNNYGFFSITMESDSAWIQCTYLGFGGFSQKMALKADVTLNIALQPEGMTTEVVEITAEETITESSSMSTVEVPIEMIKAIPSLMGEVDVIKALQLLPGVQSGSEGSTGMYVRGGGPDQNLILLDGVPVYNVSHLFGFFSLFNADAIRNVTLVKGGFPARYGGRLSSVVDINLKEGNLNEFHGDASIGLVASKLTLEGPIQKGKTSFLVSGRRTYLDVLAQPLIRKSLGGPAGYYFYDLNGKINHTFSEKDRLYFSVYHGNDRFYAKFREEETWNGTTYLDEQSSELKWGNSIAALRWNHVFTPKLFGNLTGTYSKYHFGVGASILSEERQGSTLIEKSYTELSYDSGIRDWALKLDFDYYASKSHMVRFGAYGTLHRFTPGVVGYQIQEGGTKIDTSLGSVITDALETGIYIEDDWSISPRLKANLGFHASAFRVNDEFYFFPQPRISARYKVAPTWALKASWANTAQYIHLLANSNVGLPTDLWVPATDRVDPQRAWQAAAGVAHTLLDDKFELSIEGYYKDMRGLIDYKEGASFIGIDNDWQNKVVTGRGWAYGAEFLLQKKAGKTTGWIGYTLAWTTRQFDELNEGKPFPYKYDRRHDASLVISHTVSDKIDMGFTWVYGTGNALTLPNTQYTGIAPGDFSYLFTAQYFDTKNSFRMRAYHRADLGINFHKQKKYFKRTWSLSVYNAYSRRNPFYLYFDTDYQTNTPVLKQVSLFPIIPSVAYRIQF